MATQAMYKNKTIEFLTWYYNRFAKYRHYQPNNVHHWLADKNLITQNIDGLDAKAGNDNYLAIHDQKNPDVAIITTPWDKVDESYLSESLLDLFKINKEPELNKSFKPYVLLFDEIYTELYQIKEACLRMRKADRIIFMGTSFSVNITNIAFLIAIEEGILVEVVDPDPISTLPKNTTIHKMKVSTYINKVENGTLT